MNHVRRGRTLRNCIGWLELVDGKQQNSKRRLPHGSGSQDRSHGEALKTDCIAITAKSPSQFYPLIASESMRVRRPYRIALRIPKRSASLARVLRRGLLTARCCVRLARELRRIYYFRVVVDPAGLGFNPLREAHLRSFKRSWLCFAASNYCIDSPLTIAITGHSFKFLYQRCLHPLRRCLHPAQSDQISLAHEISGSAISKKIPLTRGCS